MIERSYGKLQGKYHKAIIAKYGKEMFDKWHRAYDFPPPGGESAKMVEKRVLSFIKELLAFMKREKVNVAISAHGNSMRPFRRYFEHLTIEQMGKLENPWDNYFGYVVEA
jgi:2,3-bisphosphoglycerate-dependent phosphoglycerate mutase